MANLIEIEKDTKDMARHHHVNHKSKGRSRDVEVVDNKSSEETESAQISEEKNSPDKESNDDQVTKETKKNEKGHSTSSQCVICL